MANYLLVVEGAHDAAFFGKIVKNRRFHYCTDFNSVPEFWRALIPTQYPANDVGRLDRIMVFPDFYHNKYNGNTFAISVAGSDSKLIDTLRKPIEIRDLANFAGIGVALDVDRQKTEFERFSGFRQSLVSWVESSEADGIEGFPIPLPNQPGEITSSHPKLGIFLFPGSGAQGALETTLLECAAHSLGGIPQRVSDFVSDLHAEFPDTPDVKDSKSGAGNEKAQCGIIANLIRPGSSLAVSLRQSSWMPADENAVDGVRLAVEFIDKLLEIG